MEIDSLLRGKGNMGKPSSPWKGSPKGKGKEKGKGKDTGGKWGGHKSGKGGVPPGKGKESGKEGKGKGKGKGSGKPFEGYCSNPKCGKWGHKWKDCRAPGGGASKEQAQALDAEGRPLPGGGGYRYFGAARDLPGVKELFEAPPPQKKRRTRGDMMKNVTPDYYGFRDDDDGGELKAQEEAVERPRIEEARAASS